jgi:hypothetical protein
MSIRFDENHDRVILENTNSGRIIVLENAELWDLQNFANREDARIQTIDYLTDCKECDREWFDMPIDDVLKDEKIMNNIIIDVVSCRENAISDNDLFDIVDRWTEQI